MRAIIIGAGRGRRLMPTTENAPKCFAEIRGKRILGRTLDALHACGVTDICFIGGYCIDVVEREYPGFTFRHNREWESNNILVSLMCAEDLMDRPFVTTNTRSLTISLELTGIPNPVPPAFSANPAPFLTTSWTTNDAAQMCFDVVVSCNATAPLLNTVTGTLNSANVSASHQFTSINRSSCAAGAPPTAVIPTLSIAQMTLLSMMLMALGAVFARRKGRPHGRR